jgi:hypothetical protein
MDEFQKLIGEKVRALRRALERASAEVPLAGRLLESMKAELRGLEEGTIRPPHAISQWRIYVGGDYEIEGTHPDVTAAFADLELALGYDNVESYLKMRNKLEDLAKPYKPAS